ncbi:MAG TPA: MBL fold metallo-hydrolase [Methylomirabilota bacterium]|nr:MBL fold metallo-hydrolase [Methylomirabilota bacterium]
MHFAFLGTSGAVPSIERDTTSLVFVGQGQSVLVDCGGSPVQKLLHAKVDPMSLARVIITHIHPDHAYGLPSLIQNLFLLGRTAPLGVSCREEHVEPLRRLLGLFDLLDRPAMFPIGFDAVPARESVHVAETPSFTITGSPNAHGRMPNLALRFDVRETGQAVVYSSDTEPCDAVAALARGADTLIHEATFAERGRGRFGAHSTAGDAGVTAARAGVRRLILTHIDPEYHGEIDTMAAEARARFSGVVEISQEFVPYPL